MAIFLLLTLAPHPKRKKKSIRKGAFDSVGHFLQLFTWCNLHYKLRATHVHHLWKILVHIPGGKICLVYFAVYMLLHFCFFAESTCICTCSYLFYALGLERATLYIYFLDWQRIFLMKELWTGKKKCYLSLWIWRKKYTGAQGQKYRFISINLCLPLVMICGSSRPKLGWPTFLVLYSFWGKGGRGEGWQNNTKWDLILLGDPRPIR